MPKGSAINKAQPLKPEFAEALGVSSLKRGEASKLFWEMVREFAEQDDDGKNVWPIQVPAEYRGLLGTSRLTKPSDVMKAASRIFQSTK